MNKSELRTELGIASLPARRYLWDLIKNLRDEQEAVDGAVAIEAHQEEIDQLSRATTEVVIKGQGPDIASGGGDNSSSRGSLSVVLDGLRTDAQRQKQIIEDHLLAHRMQQDLKLGQQVYEDADVARQEQTRLNELLAQAEADRVVAENLASTREERAAVSARRQQEMTATFEGLHVHPAAKDQQSISSLFGLAIKSCVANKINVAEALQTKPATDSDDDNEEEDRKPAAVETQSQCYLLKGKCDV